MKYYIIQLLENCLRISKKYYLLKNFSFETILNKEIAKII